MPQLEPGHCPPATLRPHRTASLRRGASWAVASPHRVEPAPAGRGTGGDHLDTADEADGVDYGRVPFARRSRGQLRDVRLILAQPAPGGIRPPEESQTLLTAEPLDLDYKHQIIRRVHQERDPAPAVRAEMQ
jgi:hypothetical protein